MQESWVQVCVLKFWAGVSDGETTALLDVYHIELNRKAELVLVAEEGEAGVSYIGINKEAGFVLYSWNEDTGLVSLSRCSLCRRKVFRL